jgi:hypothetical protein
MADVPSNRALLRSSSDTPNLFARPGRCHTGSMAALDVFTSIPGSASGKAGRVCDLVTILPSTWRDPDELARSSSVILIWAFVHDIVGLTSSPLSICYHSARVSQPFPHVGTHRLEYSLGQMTPWIQRDNLVVVKPTWLRGDIEWRVSVCIIRFMVWVEGVHGDSECSIDRVRARMGPTESA